MQSSQPMLVLFLSLALGFIGAGAIASGAFVKSRGIRALYLGECAVAIVLFGYTITGLDLRFNFTPSMPVGIYRITPPSPERELQRGMFVSVCGPLRAAELGRRRGYLAIGNCPGHAEPLLKMIAAVAGAELAVSADGITINGSFLPHSQPLRFDAAARPLSPWPSGRYRLRPGQLWLYAANNRSWDSRYWGPVPVQAVLAQATPVIILTFGFLPENSFASRHFCRIHA
jgi:conjugative transfer signal peptidase TraF